MDRPDGLSEEALLAHLRGEASPEDSARIEAATAQDADLRAELALMGGLKGALGAATDGPDTREFGWRRLEAEIGKTTQTRPRQPQFWRIAAVFLGALVLGQGTYIALMPGSPEAPGLSHRVGGRCRVRSGRRVRALRPDGRHPDPAARERRARR